MAEQSAAKPRSHSFRAFLFFIVALAMVAGVLYFLSDLNARRYKMALDGDFLVIERGRFFPAGFERYRPEVESQATAYAPIPTPPEAEIDTQSVFDDRSDLDRALFALLAGWARDRLDSPDPEIFERAMAYVDRAEQLPGISEDQRTEARRLRGNLSFHNAVHMLEEVDDLMRRAKEAFTTAIRLGSPRSDEARLFIKQIEDRLNQGAFVPHRETIPDGGARENDAPTSDDAFRPKNQPDGRLPRLNGDSHTRGGESQKWRL